MNRKTLAALLLAMAGIGSFALLLPEQAIAPGSVAAPHHAFAQDCFACHAAFTGAAAHKCMECHRIDAIGVTNVAGLPVQRTSPRPAFHQQLVDQDCLACHTEHEGVARLESSRRFSHDLLRPELQDRCTSCHRKPDDSLHAQISGSCLGCHAQTAWKPATFDHAQFFLLTGEHQAACVTCHAGGEYRRYTCYGCHAHTPERIRAEHEEEGIRNFEHCVECHRSGTREEGEGGGHDD